MKKIGNKATGRSKKTRKQGTNTEMKEELMTYSKESSKLALNGWRKEAIIVGR